jgi:hypothetical protein
MRSLLTSASSKGFASPSQGTHFLVFSPTISPMASGGLQGHARGRISTTPARALCLATWPGWRSDCLPRSWLQLGYARYGVEGVGFIAMPACRDFWGDGQLLRAQQPMHAATPAAAGAAAQGTPAVAVVAYLMMCSVS